MTTWPSPKTDFRSWRGKRRDRAFERGSRRGKAVWREDGILRTRMRERDVDQETEHRRALDDARGDFAGRHVFACPHGLTEEWVIRRAVSGRTDQYEVFVGGLLAVSVGAKLLGLLVAERYRRGPMGADEMAGFVERNRPKKRAKL